MRLPIGIGVIALTLAAVGCGGTTFYDVQGEPPERSLSGKRIVIKPFEAGAVMGMTNNEAAEAATNAFTSALFGKAGIKIINRQDLAAILKERNMAEMAVEDIDESKLAAIAEADAVVSGRVVTAKQEGPKDRLTGSEVEISVRATDLKGEMFWRASQRAVSSTGGFGFGRVRLGKTPARPPRELLDEICKNLAALLSGDG